MYLPRGFIHVFIILLAVRYLVRAHGEESYDSIMNDSRITQHIKEHLKDQTDIDVDALSDEELHFYYFLLHDYDDNKKLDGLEMYQALEHNDNNNDSTEAEIVELVDYILDNNDPNSDGYIDYPEYIEMQKNVHHHHQEHNSPR